MGFIDEAMKRVASAAAKVRATVYALPRYAPVPVEYITIGIVDSPSCLYLSAYLSVYLSVFLSVYQFLCPSMNC